MKLQKRRKNTILVIALFILLFSFSIYVFASDLPANDAPLTISGEENSESIE